MKILQLISGRFMFVVVFLIISSACETTPARIGSADDSNQEDTGLESDANINIDEETGIVGTVANEQLNVSLTETTSYVHIAESGSNDNQTYDEEDNYYIEVYGDTSDDEKISVNIHFYDYYAFLANTVYSLNSEDLGDVSVGSKTYLISSLEILFEEYSNKDGSTVSGVAQVELDDNQGNVTIRFSANLYYETFFAP